MTNYRIIEDRAYELAEEDLSVKEVATRLISIYGIGGKEAWEIAEMAVEDTEADREGLLTQSLSVWALRCRPVFPGNEASLT